MTTNVSGLYIENQYEGHYTDHQLKENATFARDLPGHCKRGTL